MKPTKMEMDLALRIDNAYWIHYAQMDRKDLEAVAKAAFELVGLIMIEAHETVVEQINIMRNHSHPEVAHSAELMVENLDNLERIAGQIHNQHREN